VFILVRVFLKVDVLAANMTECRARINGTSFSLTATDYLERFLERTVLVALLRIKSFGLSVLLELCSSVTCV
jgi:hypothetical protein